MIDLNIQLKVYDHNEKIVFRNFVRNYKFDGPTSVESIKSMLKSTLELAPNEDGVDKMYLGYKELPNDRIIDKKTSGLEYNLILNK